MTFEHLKDFVECYKPGERHEREETWSEENEGGRWRKYTYEEITNRDKTSLDITWLKDDSLTDLENLPEPEVLAEQIVENLEAGLDSFRQDVDELEIGRASCREMGKSARIALGDRGRVGIGRNR